MQLSREQLCPWMNEGLSVLHTCSALFVVWIHSFQVDDKLTGEGHLRLLRSLPFIPPVLPVSSSVSHSKCLLLLTLCAGNWGAWTILSSVALNLQFVLELIIEKRSVFVLCDCLMTLQQHIQLRIDSLPHSKQVASRPLRDQTPRL